MDINIDAKQVVEWCLLTGIGGALSFVVKFLADISHSIIKLNVAMATIVERTERHGEDLDNHETRLERLEQRRK